MKILFIGPYRQTDGWGEAAKDYIKALSLLDHELSIKPVFLSTSVSPDISNNLQKLEQTRLSGMPDIIIQNTLPHLMSPVDGCINIGLCFLETSDINYTLWPRYLNLMDHVWVSSSTEKTTLLNCAEKNISIIPMPLNTDELDREFTRFELPADTYYFYFIGELIDRKNIDALLMAFHREFHTSEPVGLVFKVNKVGANEQYVDVMMRQKIEIFRRRARIYQDINGYHPEIIITKRLSKEVLIGLHKECSCFVMPSRGESLCRPLMDAVYLGNQAIITNNTGMVDLAQVADIYQVCSRKEPVYLDDSPPLPNLYTGRETWREIDIIDLQQCMRHAYQHKNQHVYNKQKILDEFSYQSVANKIQGFINEFCDL